MGGEKLDGDSSDYSVLVSGHEKQIAPVEIVRSNIVQICVISLNVPGEAVFLVNLADHVYSAFLVTRTPEVNHLRRLAPAIFPVLEARPLDRSTIFVPNFSYHVSAHRGLMSAQEALARFRHRTISLVS